MMSLPVSVLQLLPIFLSEFLSKSHPFLWFFRAWALCGYLSKFIMIGYSFSYSMFCMMMCNTFLFSVFRCSSRNSPKWDNETPTWRHSPPSALGKNAKWTRQEQQRQALRYGPLHRTICAFDLAFNSLKTMSGDWFHRLSSLVLWFEWISLNGVNSKLVWFVFREQCWKHALMTRFLKYFNSHINHSESTWLKLAWLTLQKTTTKFWVISE